MDFVDVVMKRRAVRRFEEGGVERDVIERIARLAQRTPSAGFSQGQRLIVVTEPERRREVARLCGEEEYEADFGRAVDLGMRRAVHPVRLRGGLPPALPGARQAPGRRHRDRLADPLLVGRRRRDDAERHARGGQRGSRLRVRRHRRGRLGAAPGVARHPGRIHRRSASCRSGARCPTSAHRRSSGAGCRSRSSRTGSAGAEARHDKSAGGAEASPAPGGRIRRARSDRLTPAGRSRSRRSRHRRGTPDATRSRRAAPSCLR